MSLLDLPPMPSAAIQRHGRDPLRAYYWVNWAQWLLLLASALLAAAFLAWVVLARINFLYPVWHDLIGIDHTIDTFAPQNRYRSGFERTSKAERSRLFAGIVRAIHGKGVGLHGLVYHDSAGRPLGKLLRTPEIVHLRDVARLVDVMRAVGAGALAITFVLLLAMCRQRLTMPPPPKLLLCLVVPLAGTAIAVLLIGPVKTFYWLHTLVFPPGHQWFFYYQDSLMSTMMRAPDLFGYIGLLWMALNLLLLIAFLSFVKRMLGPA